MARCCDGCCEPARWRRAGRAGGPAQQQSPGQTGADIETQIHSIIRLQYLNIFSSGYSNISCPWYWNYQRTDMIVGDIIDNGDSILLNSKYYEIIWGETETLSVYQSVSHINKSAMRDCVSTSAAIPG